MLLILNKVVMLNKNIQIVYKLSLFLFFSINDDIFL